MPTTVDLTADQAATLEAVADTVLPGRKRGADDLAIAGVDDTPGAVEAGALSVLTHPATGIADGVGGMADLLNDLAAARADGGGGCPPFVALSYEQRRTLLAQLCQPDSPTRELWFLVMLFAYMAYDSAPHLDTATAVRTRHVGFTAMDFRAPDADGLWRNPDRGYGRPTARPRHGTDERGNLA